jgi:hypothetical protein
MTITREEPLPMEYIPRRSRRLSDAAAHAAQQWEDIEAERDQFKLGLDSANARISILEETNAILHESVRSAEVQRDYFQRRCLRLLTFIEQIGSLTIQAAKETEPPIITEAIAAALQKVTEDHLGDENDKSETTERKVPLLTTPENPPRSEGGPSPFKDK